ncbi:hypothetical protein, partial [Sulfurimonas indica]|uniref:hypothetical protein n=1 Tax=Sulfurimonas indica TaxID=2508707 RepID=UPI001CB70762
LQENCIYDLNLGDIIFFYKRFPYEIDEIALKNLINDLNSASYKFIQIYFRHLNKSPSQMIFVIKIPTKGS